MDIVKRNKAWAKENAIELVRHFEKEWMKLYSAPSRKGVPKGEPIGMFEKKWRAVSYMVLHPPLSLKEVASLMDNTSYDQLRQWKTQDDFKKVSEKAAELFSKVLIEKIESVIGNVDFWHGPKDINQVIAWAAVLPFFNHSVNERIVWFLKKKIDETNSEDGRVWWIEFTYRALKEANVKDFRSLQKWESRPTNIEAQKISIEFSFQTLIYEPLEALFSDPAALSNPKIRKRHLSQLNENFRLIKREMFRLVYTLAGLQEKLDERGNAEEKFS